MSIIHVENLSKSYGEKKLFEAIEFHIEKEDRIGVVGINGTGKSTLLKIISGYEKQDKGHIIKGKKVTVEYLSQSPVFDEESTVIEQVLKGDSPIYELIRSYEAAVEKADKNQQNGSFQEDVLKLSEQMSFMEAWEIESQVKTILTRLNIHDFDKKIKFLSGGQKKRVAIAGALLAQTDLLILDEPTNHLDSETIDFIEQHLKNRKGALLMVTHDRYFLDRVCNRILEISHGQLYSYTGNYTTYVQAKAERMALANTLEQKTQNLYRRELAWIRTGAKARSTKQKARIQRFEELKNKSFITSQETVDISVPFTRMGKKTIILQHISKSYGEHHLFKDINYTILPEDRLGIVGKSGVGKTTLLEVITGMREPDEGYVDIGETIKLGYFSQEAKDMDTSLRCIDYIKATAEYADTKDGIRISASQMMERFLISGDMQYAPIHSLSGGEKRRLYLLKVLMEAPNVLILDEPTNDLDIDTLKVLENYIDAFPGIVITVSHDRYFLDRTCNVILGFEGAYVYMNRGDYEDYKAYIADSIEDKAIKKVAEPEVVVTKQESNEEEVPKKLTYQELNDYKVIDEEINTLMEQLDGLQQSLEENQTSYTKLQEIGEKIEETEEILMEKMAYQEYLENKDKAFKNYKNSK